MVGYNTQTRPGPSGSKLPSVTPFLRLLLSHNEYIKGYTGGKRERNADGESSTGLITRDVATGAQPSRAKQAATAGWRRMSRRALRTACLRHATSRQNQV